MTIIRTQADLNRLYVLNKQKSKLGPLPKTVNIFESKFQTSIQTSAVAPIMNQTLKNLFEYANCSDMYIVHVSAIY